MYRAIASLFLLLVAVAGLVLVFEYRPVPAVAKFYLVSPNGGDGTHLLSCTYGPEVTLCIYQRRLDNGHTRIYFVEKDEPPFKSDDKWNPERYW